MFWLLLPAFILIALAMTLQILGTRAALAIKPTPLMPVKGDTQGEETHDDLRSIRHWAKPIVAGLVIVAIATFVLMATVWVSSSFAMKYVYTFLCILLAYNLAHLFRRWAVRITVALITLGVTAVWFFEPSWLLADLLAIGLVVTIVLYFQPRVSFVSAAITMILIAALYDATQVFTTGNMLKAASTDLVAPMPDVITIPTHLSLTASAATLLGLGDIAVPGMLIVIAGRIGQRVGSHLPYLAGIFGYAVGLVATFVAVVTFDIAQPALIYLIPSVSLVVVLAVWRLGCWRELTRRAYDPMRVTQVEEAAE